ncbi:hypothetical protein ACLMJK_006021 [Lecanora helva]
MTPVQETLNVVGLISGGKDSFFSLLHCIANKHRLVALANLCPPGISSLSDASEDLNSFMYQTAGHTIVPLYSEALSLPLYRQEIQGSALVQSKDYRAPELPLTRSPNGVDTQILQDETESLVPLLRKVIHAHPTVNAICSGAILSTYQRTRVESVARRLNLVPLSYLWQYPSLPPPSPDGLLDDMAAAGFDVRIVKVASGGLDEDLLWCNLVDPRTRAKVQKAVNRFGGSVLGEGGEYETLVVDGMAPFWKGRLEVDSNALWIGRGDGGEAWVGFKQEAGLIVSHENARSAADDEWRRSVRIPELWDAEFWKLAQKTITLSPLHENESQNYNLADNPLHWKARTTLTKTSLLLKLNNVTTSEAGFTVCAQITEIKSRLLDLLKESDDLDTGSIVFTTILLRTMADFSSVNGIYGSLFTQPNPPARVTVACGDTMPPKIDVMVSCVICLDKRLREGLHVQSRSYWAPANIGPYSQAISLPLRADDVDPRIVYVAGQIPLVPATMEILQNEQGIDDVRLRSKLEMFQERAYLSLQHLWRIGEAMNVNWWMAAVAFLVGEDDIQAKASIAWECWRKVHEVGLWESRNQDVDDDGLDVWDKTHGGFGSLANAVERSRLPDFSRSHNPPSSNVPPFLAVQVSGLPRECDVEWQSSGIAYSNSMTPTVRSICSHIAIPQNDSDDVIQCQLREVFDKQKHVGTSDATIYTTRPDLVGEISAQVVPCRSVWGPAGSKLAAGISVHDDISLISSAFR